jgi:pimeloyl-ACP methyl ester carboxylesterase
MEGHMAGNPEPRVRDIHFHQDDGYQIDGTLYLPSAGEPGMSIVFCHGYLGTRAILAPEVAAGLIQRTSAAVLAFDYSGFGTSEGPRRRLDPWREVRDVRAAVSWMTQEFPAARVGLLGVSFGGAISTVAAATDDRVGALVALSAFASGSRWMRDLRPNWQWIAFQEELSADRVDRVLTGASRAIDPDWIMPRDPESAAFNQKLLQEFPERKVELDVVSAERIAEFEPLDVASRLQSTPSLYMHAIRDLLIPFGHAEDLAAAACGKLLPFDGIGHYGFYEGQPLVDFLDNAAGWYDANLYEPSRGG